MAKASGEHFAAADLIGVLERATQQQHPVILASKDAFLQALQAALDFLFDVRNGVSNRKAYFARVGLAHWAIDELLVAFHLAQRAFVNQAYSQLRTVEEVLDKLELFSREPESAEFWVDEADERAVWNRLKPSRVRKKLGRDGGLYSFLSTMGPHTSFRGLQARGGFFENDRDERVATIFIGGAPFEHQLVACNVLLVRAASALATTVARVFSSALNADEAKARLDACAAGVAALVEAHLVPLALDRADVRELLARLKKPA